MHLIEKALQIALKAHTGQIDKCGQPYILHPLRVMARCQSEKARLVAILHDVIEDSDMTLAELRDRGFNDEIINAVDAISRRDDEDYFDYIERVKHNALAVEVKIADLQDNMDPFRLSDYTPRVMDRLKRYRQAWAILSDFSSHP